jgi:DNA invertase Pin-like site-specific DNA recombinase
MPDYIPPPPTLPPGSRVFAYLRDSGGREQEQSVIQQRADITTYCEKHGLFLERVFADVARSGGSTKGRDQFTTMIDTAADPQARPAGLLVWNLSRFSRDVDDSAFYKAFLRRLGVVIHSLTDHIPEGLAGRILESVKDYSNADYLDQLKVQIKRALETNVRAGYAEGGFPPRGYLAEKVTIGRKRDGNPRIVSRWIPDPELFPLAVLAWKLRAQGKPYAEITKATGGKLYLNSGSWTTFFCNETYRGIGKCGEVKIPDHHEAAVSLEDWQKVQELRRDRSSRMQGMTHPRRVRYPSLLSGLARCVHCGAAMVHHHRGGKWKKYTYYVCGQRDRKHGVQVCEGRRINARKADAAILDAVLSRVLTPAFLEEIFEEVRLQLTDAAALGDEIKRKRDALQLISQAIRNLLDLAETFGSEAARARLKERETEQAILKAEIKSLEARRANADIEISPGALQITLDAWTGSLVALHTAGDTGALRSFLARFISKVDLGYNQARIHYTFPLDAIDPNVLCSARGTFR